MKTFLLSLGFFLFFSTSCQSEPPQRKTKEDQKIALEETTATTPKEKTEEPAPTAASKSTSKASGLSLSKADGLSLSKAEMTKKKSEKSSTAKGEHTTKTEKTATPAPQAQSEEDNGLSHQLWNDLLRSYVSSDGRVDYAGMRSEEAKLDKYLAQLKAYPPQADWSKEEEMAFWINAYNAFTIKLILDNYPVKSIRELYKGNPWDVKWIKIGNKTYSLNEIENDMLRTRFGDARIHFALNCAAKSCPPLYNRAWEAANLSQMLDARARAFINHPGYNRIKPNQAELSKIFDWYAGDFGNLTAFINRYAQTKLQPEASITFLEYDWALNGK